MAEICVCVCTFYSRYGRILIGQVLRSCFVCALEQIITDDAVADTTHTHMTPSLVVIKVTRQPSDV